MSEARTSVDPNSAIASLTGHDSESVPEPEKIETPEVPVAIASGIPEAVLEEATEDPVPPTQEAYDKLIKESMGRKGAIDELREQLRTQTENIGAMQEMFVESQTPDAPTDAELYGQEVVSDPAIQYLTSKMEGLQQQITHDRTQRIDAAQKNYKAASQRRNVDETREFLAKTEQAFSEKHPDYGDAYDYFRKVRSNLHRSRGYDDTEIQQLLSNEENSLIDEALSRGRNPVEDLYNMSKTQGFVPPAPAPAPARDFAAESARRVSGGVNSGSIGSMAGAPSGSKPSGILTRQEFMTNIPKAERMRILSDSDRFEELAKTGNITLK